jgi:hypothetical protein
LQQQYRFIYDEKLYLLRQEQNIQQQKDSENLSRTQIYLQSDEDQNDK